MKVGELIEKLKQYDSEEEVIVKEYEILDVRLVDEDRPSMFGPYGSTFHIRWVEIT